MLSLLACVVTVYHTVVPSASFALVPWSLCRCRTLWDLTLWSCGCSRKQPWQLLFLDSRIDTTTQSYLTRIRNETPLPSPSVCPWFFPGHHNAPLLPSTKQTLSQPHRSQIKSPSLDICTLHHSPPFPPPSPTARHYPELHRTTAYLPHHAPAHHSPNVENYNTSPVGTLHC